jgi:hypothetical protein
VAAAIVKQHFFISFFFCANISQFFFQMLMHQINFQFLRFTFFFSFFFFFVKTKNLTLFKTSPNGSALMNRFPPIRVFGSINFLIIPKKTLTGPERILFPDPRTQSLKLPKQSTRPPKPISANFNKTCLHLFFSKVLPSSSSLAALCICTCTWIYFFAAYLFDPLQLQ